MKKYLTHPSRVDHLAIAVIDLEEAVQTYVNTLGFELIDRKEAAAGDFGMRSVELCCGGFTVVLIQGVGEESQVSRFVKHYGAGVQHVAIEVEDLNGVVEELTDSGVEFSTGIIVGDSLKQIFTVRDKNSGVMFELIERMDADSVFEKNNVAELFDQLQNSGHF